jgi:VWFA-related protein
MTGRSSIVGRGLVRMRPAPVSMWRALFLGLAALTAAARAQQPPADPVSYVPFAERIEVSVVELEVLVTDRDGNPIEGLPSDAFTLYEDGRRVEITAFEELRRQRTAPTPAAPQTSTGSLPLPVEGADIAYLVIWVDVAALDPLHRNRVLGKLREEAVAGRFSGYWIAVAAYDHEIEVLQPFTRDASAVAAALDSLQNRVGNPLIRQRQGRRLVAELRDIVNEIGCDAGKYAAAARAHDHSAERSHEIEGSLRALGEFVNALGGLPGEKDLLVVSEGLAIRPGEELFGLIGEWCNDHRLQLEGQTLPGIAALDRLASLASQRRARLHFVDASGLAAYAPHDVTEAGAASSAVPELVRRNNEREVPLVLAERTGGQAILDANEAGAAVRRLLETSGHRYRLVYTPARQGDARDHALAVEVARRGAVVRHRRVHRDRSTAMRLADRTMGTLWYELDHNPLGISVSFGTPEPGAPGTHRLPVKLSIPIDRLSLVPDGDHRSGRIEVFAASRDGRGRRSAPMHVALPIRIPQRAATGGIVEHELRLTLRDGTAKLAITVYDALAGVGSYLIAAP